VLIARPATTSAKPIPPIKQSAFESEIQVHIIPEVVSLQEIGQRYQPDNNTD
jgi:hypothetical protein